MFLVLHVCSAKQLTNPVLSSTRRGQLVGPLYISFHDVFPSMHSGHTVSADKAAHRTPPVTPQGQVMPAAPDPAGAAKEEAAAQDEGV